MGFFIVKGGSLLKHSSFCTCTCLPDDGQHARLKQAVEKKLTSRVHVFCLCGLYYW